MSADSDNHPDNIARRASQDAVWAAGLSFEVPPVVPEHPHLPGCAPSHPTRPVPESKRARRFSLPDLGNERVDEAITSFLSGPQNRRGRRGQVVSANSGGNAFATLETRIAWLEALRRETARSVRYRRPAAILVIAGEAIGATPEANAWAARVAGPIAHTLRRGLRDTDLVTRTGDARFQVLLPETTGAEARHVAERVVADCRVWLEAVGAPITVRVGTAGTAPDSTLDMALERALRSLDPAQVQ